MADPSHGPRRSALTEFGGGWKVLLGGTWGIAVGVSSLPFYTAGVLVRPLREAFGWSLSQISMVMLSSTVAVAIFAPLAGIVVDRLGVIRPAAFGLVALALSFACLGSMPGSYATYLAISVCTAILALTSSPISFSRLINGRFDTARGLALGVALSGTGLAAMIAPPAIAAVIADHGWRFAYYSLAAVVLLSIPFVLVLLASDQPAPRRASTATDTPVAKGPDFGSIIRDRRFLRLFLAFFLQALGVSGFVLHLVPMLQEAGIPTARAALIQGQMGVAIIAGRILIGFLVDRLFAPRVAAAVLTATVAGLACFALAGPVMAVPMALALGLALGAEVDLIGYLTVRYFGLAAYGRIYGLLYGGFVLATGLSPVVIAQLHLVRGDYQPALWGSVGFVTIALALLASAPRFPARSGA